MSQQGRLTAAKRERERNLAERRKQKAAQRAEARDRQASGTRSGSTDGDPDIDHITPGPQPLQDWQQQE
jgi:hypothetical protein